MASASTHDCALLARRIIVPEPRALPSARWACLFEAVPGPDRGVSYRNPGADLELDRIH